MFYSNTLNLIQVGGGTQVKQGDLGSKFSYKLANEKGQELDNFDKGVAHINLVLDDKIVFTTTATVDNSTVTFNIDKAIPAGLYFLEIKIRDYIFPSDRQTVIFVQSGGVAYDLKDLVPNYDTNMTLKGILSDLSQKGIDISDLNRRMAKKANKDEVTNVMTPKGTLAYASLPTSGNQVGWYYYCPDGDGTHGAGNYVWNGTSWYFGGTGDEGYNLLKKDLDDISKSEVPFVRFEKDFKKVFSYKEYDNGIVSEEKTYSDATQYNENTANAVSVWRDAYITGAVINTQNQFNELSFPSNSKIGSGKLAAMLCEFDETLILKSGLDFKYRVIEEHDFEVDGTSKWVKVVLDKTYEKGKYIILVRRDSDSTTNGTFFSGFAINGIYCSEYDDDTARYGLINIGANGKRTLFTNSYALPIFVFYHEKEKVYSVKSPIQNKKILFFGDSITAGEPSNGNFYVPRLIKKTGAILSANYAVWGAKWHHVGNVDGDTSTNNTIPNQVYKMLSEKKAGTYSDTPDIVVFSAGTNDHTRNENGATIRNQFLSDSGGYLSIDDCNLNSYIGSIRWCYEKVQDAFPSAQIFLATPIQGNETTRFVEIIEYIADTIKAVSRRLSCCVIDAYEKSNIYGRYEVKNANGKCLRDGLHPNDYGSDLMAECYRLEIETQYKEIN